MQILEILLWNLLEFDTILHVFYSSWQETIRTNIVNMKQMSVDLLI